MKRARFTGEQIIAVSKEHEAGAKTADLARKHGISEATIHNWKAKFGGMDVCEAKRLIRALEEENAKLKKLLAEQSSMRLPFASCFQKLVGPAAKRAAASGRGSAWPVARSRQRAAPFRLPPARNQQLVAEQSRPLQERLGRVLSDASR